METTTNVNIRYCSVQPLHLSLVFEGTNSIFGTMQLSDYVQPVYELHPEFSLREIEDVCNDYLSQFSAKTKESTKEKSLKKYLAKEFGVQWEDSSGDDFQSQPAFSSLPKSLFQYTNKKSADYLITIKSLYKQIG